ncbi:MAG: hypothetical protein ACFFBP_10710 [Promethearchaeota archaeon]
MHKNYDNLALGLAIVGLSVASLEFFVALGLLPEFLRYVSYAANGASMAGLIFGIISLKTTVHAWKPILAIIFFCITTVITIIALVALLIQLIPLIRELIQLIRS